MARFFGPADVHRTARTDAGAGPQGRLHRRPRHAGPRHARRHVRRNRIGSRGGRRPALVLLDPSAAGKGARQPADMGPLRQCHEAVARKLPPRHRRARHPQRQRTGVGFVRRTPDYLDGFGGGRASRHPAQRLSGRNQRIVVQCRMLYAQIGVGERRHGVRPGMGGASGPHRGFVQQAVPTAAGLSGRRRGRRRSRRHHPSQHDYRVRTSLQDARHRDANRRHPHRSPAPADPQGPALADAPQPALQGHMRRLACRTRLRGEKRLGVAVAAAVLCAGVVRHRRRRFSAAGRGNAGFVRGRDPGLRHRVDQRSLRRRPALRPPRCHFAGMERRGRARALPHDTRPQRSMNPVRPAAGIG